ELASVVRREGVTVFLTTHNLSEAEKLCSRVAVIRHGRLLAEGPPDELRSRKGGQQIGVCGNGFRNEILDSLRGHPLVHSATLRDDRLLLQLSDGSKAAPLVRLLVEAGAEIEEVRKA